MAKEELKLTFKGLSEKEKITITDIDSNDVGKKQKTSPIEVEYKAAMKEIETLIKEKYTDLRLRFVKSGNAYIIYQGSPTNKWAAFRLYTPNIYRGSLKRILHDNNIIEKYPTYFKFVT